MLMTEFSFILLGLDKGLYDKAIFIESNVWISLLCTIYIKQDKNNYLTNK